MNNKNFSFIFILLAFLVLTGCKSKELITSKKLANKKHLPELVNYMEKNQFSASWLSMKASIDFSRNNKNTGFKANIILKKDSMIWVSITPLIGVEVARIVFSPDSVKMVNRIEKNYFIGTFTYINTLLNTDLDYFTLQSLLLGNNLNLDENEKLKASIDDGYFLLSGVRKRKLRKSMEKDEYKDKKEDERIFSAWIDPVTYKITKQSFVDFETDNYLEVNYKSFKQVENQLFPHNTTLKIEGLEKIFTEITYSGLELNKEKKMPFSISEKYVRIY